jgi:hypothetical protein
MSNYFNCRKRAFERNCIVRNPTRLSNHRRSAIINVVAKSKSISANKKGSDIDDDEEVISPEVCVGPAKNETHSVRVILYYQTTCFKVDILCLSVIISCFVTGVYSHKK